jgi:outer membrane protein OmpA-like peptidoglycan-associated protein
MGDSFFIAGGIWYESAFNDYLKANLYNSSCAELNYKLGVSALLSDRKEDAAGFLLKAYELKKDITDDILLSTGRALQYSGKFSEAIDRFQNYLGSPGRKPKEKIARAKKCIEECQSALIITKDTLRLAIINVGSTVNSNSDDYSEVFSSDGNAMYFGTRRALLKYNNYYSDSKYDENIFVSFRNKDTWELATMAGDNLITRYCETPLYINSSNTLLYLYAGYENGGDIRVSENKKGSWSAPRPVDFKINSTKKETSFTFNPLGNEIYFISENSKDNIGGKDIFFIKRVNESKWSGPQNAGPSVNSKFDEESVRFSKTGDTLWFSSKGHNSIGGFDVFYSTRNQSGSWSSPVNRGYPVNTPFDEIFYQPNLQDDSSFYFVSNRTDGYGGLDIYEGKLLPAPKPEPVAIVVPEVVEKEVVAAPVVIPVIKEIEFIISGKIRDSETATPVLAKIDFVDISTNQVVTTTASSDIDGSYFAKLPSKKSYLIELRATGFLSDLKRVNVPVGYPGDQFSFDATLVKVKVGKKVVLNNIFFESGKSILTSASYSELNRLLSFMEDNPNIKLEISGHTDKTGSPALNFKLSEARASAVMTYLVQEGIERSRIEFRGYGSLQPISDNATPQGRAKNRRVEFKILEL